MSGGYRAWNVNDTISAADWNQYVASQVVCRFATTTARNSALTSPDDGTMCYCADTDELYKRESGVWKGAVKRIKLKTATESVTSSTTLQDDDHLFMAVEANSSYMLDMELIFDGNNALGQFKPTIVGPSGTVDYGTACGYHIRYDVSDNLIVDNYGLGMQLVANTAGTGNYRPYTIVGLTFTTSSTAGNIKLQWAQFVSNAVATRVKMGSSMELLKVG